MPSHHYSLTTVWTGNTGKGTSSYRDYERSYDVQIPQKPVLAGSSDPKFRGDPTRYNPEDLLVASLSACHMLWYLHLCSEQKIICTHYSDAAEGEMEITANGRQIYESGVASGDRDYFGGRVEGRPRVTRTGSRAVLYCQLCELSGGSGSVD